MPPKAFQAVTQMSPRVPKCPPEVPKSTKKTPKSTPRVANWRPKVPQWSPKVTQSITKTPQALQSATTTPKYAPRCQKTSKHTQTKTTNQPNKQRVAEIKKTLLAFVCMLSVPVQPRFIGYRLCRRPLGPEEWMLGCSDACRCARLVADLARIRVAFWRPLVTCGVTWDGPGKLVGASWLDWLSQGTQMSYLALLCRREH